MKKPLKPILRTVLSTVLGLAVAVAIGDPDPPTPNCFVNNQRPAWAIIKKFCKSGCTLDPGCCQVWILKDFYSEATFEFRFCAGTAYSCDTTPTPSGFYICRDAYGMGAEPSDPPGDPG